MTIRCANCGQEHYTRPIIDAEEGVIIWQWRAMRILGRVQQRLLAFLVVSMHATVSMQEIVQAVWPDPDEEPEIPENVIAVTLSRMRLRMNRLGLKVEAITGRGFCLRPIAPEAPRRQPADQSKVLEFA